VPTLPDAALAAKLGVQPGHRVVLLGAPDDLSITFPPGVAVRRRSGGSADVVVAFVTRSADLLRTVDRLAPTVFPAGGLWIAWPKRSSGVATDVTDHAVRATGLPLGLVDNKVCAVDRTWTALRLVWRKERRGGPG
jgi:hypothetical protein